MRQPQRDRASAEQAQGRPFALLVDSASIPDAEAAADLGFVAGITTNPSLMAKEDRPPLVQLSNLLQAFPGLIFYQPGTADPASAAKELKSALQLAPSRVVCKLPAQLGFATLATQLTSDGAQTALTAVYAAGQALIASAAGIQWVIPYVNRAARLDPNGSDLVQRLRRVIDGAHGQTRILAASIKSPAEAVTAVTDGAHAVTAPLAVIRDLCHHPLTESAIEAFTADGGRSVGVTPDQTLTGR